jgi:hypothetical protein
MEVMKEAVATMSTMTRSWRRPLVVAPLCALALGQGAGCSNPAGPPTTPCTVETVFSGDRQIPANTYIVQSITTSVTGRLAVTVDWVLRTNIVSTVLAQAPCSVEQFLDDRCNVILNLFPPPKPLTASTFWMNAGTYDLILGNFSPTAETASMRVVLTSTGCQVPGQE